MPTDAASILFGQRSKDVDATLPAVEVFTRAFSQKLRSRMVSRCSADFPVRVVSLEVKRLGSVVLDPEYKESGVYGQLRYDALRLPGVAVMQRKLLTRVIGLMLGDDEQPEGPDSPRALSPVELRISQRILADVARDLSGVWPQKPVPAIETEGQPGSARTLDSRGQDTESYVATLECGPSERPFGLLCFTIPVSCLRGAAPSGRAGVRPVKVKAPDMGRVMPVEIDLVAEMARVNLRLRDLKALRVGDLLPLGPISGATLRANGKPVLAGEAGHANGQRSVKVKRKLS